MMEEERNFEKEEQETRVYRERLLYAGELTKRIASVLNACENYAPAYESMANLRAFLLPQIKTDVSAQAAALRSAYNNFVQRLPHPVLNLPTQGRRPNNGYACDRSLDAAASCHFMPKSHNIAMYWSDFPGLIRETLQNYFVPGQCVQTGQVLQLAFYVFARAEVELIIKSADAHGLLLITGSAVLQGGMSFEEVE